MRSCNPEVTLLSTPRLPTDGHSDTSNAQGSEELRGCKNGSVKIEPTRRRSGRS